MFVERLISGIILVALAIAAIWVGHPVLLFAMGLLSLIGQFELYRVLKLEKTPLGFVGYFATIGYEVILFFGREDLIQVFILGTMLVFMAVYVIAYPKFVFKDVAMTFALANIKSI